MPVSLYDVAAENSVCSAQLRRAFARVLRSGRFVAGPETAAFQQELARYVGTRHAIAVSSGTDALVLALKALGIGPGHEVITTSFTFFATAEAVLLAGANPVFADIEPDTLCLSPAACAAAITARTRAVLLVHVFGHCADMDRFTALCTRHRLALVEDAAQAIGATWQGRNLGRFGKVGTFSFYPTKNLSALGNGGAVLTDDATIARTVASLQDHGAGAGGHRAVGWNSRLDELQAAFLRIKLLRLDKELARRRQIAARYDAELPQELFRVHGPSGCVSNYHQYGLRTGRRDELRAFLAAEGIETGDYYRVPVHREPAFLKTSRVRRPGSALPETEQACQEVLTLPVRPSLTNEQQTAVIAAVRRFFARRPTP
jgi:dTDP-4-amino-4,6-dideoxygalactose transaminase